MASARGGGHGGGGGSGFHGGGGGFHGGGRFRGGGGFRGAGITAGAVGLLTIKHPRTASFRKKNVIKKTDEVIE